jgi:hypothetical protein
MIKGFESPREEALEIARQARRDILAGNDDTVKILRACLVIANSLGKKDTTAWLNLELSGKFTKSNLPLYRQLNCEVTGFNDVHQSFQDYNVLFNIHQLRYFLDVKQEMRIKIDENDNDITLHLRPNHMKLVLSGIVDRCFTFLNEIISELQYGGAVEYLMEEIRRTTDNKLTNFSSKITEETQSLYLNLTSTNPADWSKVGHSCRKIFKLLSDDVYPPSDEKFTAGNGRILNLSDTCFVNRLIAFMETNSSTDEKKFLTAEIEYLESYLRQVVDYAQMVEHNPSIDKYHANLLAIHTYLVISEILRHIHSQGNTIDNQTNT